MPGSILGLGVGDSTPVDQLAELGHRVQVLAGGDRQTALVGGPRVAHPVQPPPHLLPQLTDLVGRLSHQPVSQVVAQQGQHRRAAMTDRDRP